MMRRIAMCGCFLCSVGVLSPASGVEDGRDGLDRFALDGANNITDEAHFGIVNGKLTCGVPYRDVFAVKGLWRRRMSAPTSALALHWRISPLPRVTTRGIRSRWIEAGPSRELPWRASRCSSPAVALGWLR